METARNVEILAKEFFDSYRKNKQTQRRMAEVVILLFEESDSFLGAKTNMGYRPRSWKFWEPSFSTRIRSAVKNNSQVRESWGVSDRVETLVKKWARRGV